MVESVQAVVRGFGGIGGDRSKEALRLHVGVEKAWAVRHVRLGDNGSGRDRRAPC